MDILILLAALSLGQLLGFHIYRRSGGLPPGLVIAAFAAILFLFALFTVAPPHLPLFQDSMTAAMGSRAQADAVKQLHSTLLFPHEEL